MKKWVLGIDHGNKGALTLYDGKQWWVWKMPRLQSIAGQKELLELLKNIRVIAKDLVCYLEYAGFIPGFNTGHDTFMMNYGMVQIALTVYQIPYQLVKAKDWKATILKYTAKDKQAAIDYVSRRFPDVDLIPGRCTTPQDGIADAVCITEFGYRLVNVSTRKSRRR